MTEELDWIARAGRRAKGKRPEYFDDPAMDRVLSILMAVVAEVSVLRQRQDTVERLLSAKQVISLADIEAFVPDKDQAEERGLATKAYIARVMRGVQQAMDAMEVEETPVEQISRELKEL